MCGGLLACGRGMIVVGLMVALVGAVHGAGVGKDGTSTRGASPMDAKNGQGGLSKLEGRQAPPPTMLAAPFSCLTLSDPKERDAYLGRTQGQQLGGRIYPRENWEKALDKCCPTNSGLATPPPISTTCTLRTFLETATGRPIAELFPNGVPPGKGPLTLGIILLIALIPLIPFF